MLALPKIASVTKVRSCIAPGKPLQAPGKPLQAPNKPYASSMQPLSIASSMQVAIHECRIYVAGWVHYLDGIFCKFHFNSRCFNFSSKIMVSLGLHMYIDSSKLTS